LYFVGITSVTFQVLLAYEVLREFRSINLKINNNNSPMYPIEYVTEPLKIVLVDFSVIDEGEESMRIILDENEKDSDY
jgi:hypothetical protein